MMKQAMLSTALLTAVFATGAYARSYQGSRGVGTHDGCNGMPDRSRVQSASCGGASR